MSFSRSIWYLENIRVATILMTQILVYQQESRILNLIEKYVKENDCQWLGFGLGYKIK